jgi:uncharacterized BrkB/YihY/UPF0761 family membrane protein
MAPVDLVVPPAPKLVDYPALIVVGLAVTFTTILLFVAGKFDPSGGMLTISLLVVLTFISVVIFSLFFSVPNGEAASAVIGGLTAAFGAIVAHWLGRPKEPPK